MAVKKITRIGKPLDTSFAYKYREVVSEKLSEEGLDFDTVSSAEQNRAYQKIHIDNQRNALDYVQKEIFSERVKKGDTEELDRRMKLNKEFQGSRDLLDAQERDINNSRSFGILKSVYQSTAQGFEMLASPLRLIAQGEDTAMAYKLAAENLAFHVPDGTADKYLNLMAANALPMATTMATALIPGIGLALSASLMSSYMGSNMYLDLRHKGVDKDVAGLTAVVGGIALGAVEFATGHALAGTVGKIPIVGKLFGSASRADRLRALKSLVGTKGGLTALYNAIKGHKANLSTLNKGLVAVFGSQSSKAGVLVDLARQGATEALTGGVEEWIQTGIELGLSEEALKASGLEGVIPRYPDGTVNGEAVMGMMNDAFIAGALLEGIIGGGMAMSGLQSRMSTAKSMGIVKTMLNGEIAVNKDGYAINMNQLSNDSKDYIARRILMDLSVAEKGKELTTPQRFKVIEDAKKEALSSLTDNPIEALFIDYANANIESIKDGEIAVIKIGKTRVPIVKSGDLGESGALYVQNPSGADTVKVSNEVWQQLEKLGLNKNVIAINLYQGSTLPHEVLHHIGRSLSGEQLDTFLDLFNDENLDLTKPEGEVGVQEKAAIEIEQYVVEKKTKPLSNAFKDAYARLESAVRGDKASDWVKKSMLFQGTLGAIETGRFKDIGQQVTTAGPDLAQQKKVGRAEAVKAYDAHETERKVLNNKLTKYLNAYATKHNLSDSDKQTHENFLVNTIQVLLESDTLVGATEGSARAIFLSEHVGAINTIKEHTGRMRGFAKRMAINPDVISKTVQNFLTKLQDIAAADVLQAEWTDEMQAQYNTLVQQAEQAYKTNTFVSQTTEETTRVRDYLEGPDFEPIASIVNEGIKNQNAIAKEEIAVAELKAKDEIADPQAILEARTYAEDIATSEGSQRTVSKPVGYASFKSEKLAGMLSSQNLSVLFPLTEDSYNEIFSRILNEVLNSNVAIESRSSFENGILSIGEVAYDLNSPADKKVLSELTKLYGPMWAVAVELSRYDSKATSEALAINRTRDSLVKQGRPKPKPNVLRAVSAFITTASQTEGSLIPLQIAGTAVDVPVAMQIIADDIVSWFNKVAGLKMDGSPVNFADLGGQYRSGEQAISPDLEADLQELDITLTAEAAARAFIREFVELFDPALTQQDLSNKTYQTLEGGKRKAGAAVSPAFISRIGISRKSTAGPLQEFVTFDVRDTIGELLNRISNRYGGMSNLIESGTASDTGTVDGIEDIANGVVELANVTETATEAGIIPDVSEANIGTELKAMRKLALDISSGSKKTGAYADSVESYFKKDPEMTQLNELIQRLEQDVKFLDLAQAKYKVDQKIFNLLEIQDEIFGIKDMRNTKVQIDVGLGKDSLQNKWNEIFGLETPMRFRDLIKDLVKTGTGVVKGKPVVAELKTESQKYQLAMIFALDYLNTENPKETAQKVLESIGSTITKLGAMKKRSVELDYVLAKYRQYASIQDKALDIILGRNEYGTQIKGFIDHYKELTTSYWKDFGLSEFNRAVKVEFYSPRVFTEKILDAQEGEFEMATNTGRLIARQSVDLSTAMENGRVFAHDSFMPALIAGMSQITNAQANKRLIESGIRDGFLSTEPKAGFEILKAPGAKDVQYEVFFNKKVTTFDNYSDAKEVADQNKTSVKIKPLDLYAPIEVARYLNKITKSATMRKNPFILGLLATNAKLKGLKIVWGMFHRRSFIWSAMIAGAVTPNMGFLEDSDATFMQKLKDRVNYSDKRKLGLDIMQQANKQFYDLTYFGMTTFRIQDIGRASQQYKTRAEKWLGGDSRGVPATAVNRWMGKFSTVTHRFQDELFGIFGSSLKSATAYNEYLRLFDKHSETIAREKQVSKTNGRISEQSKAYGKLFPAAGKKEADLTDYHSDTEVEILRAVAGMANADFGGLHTGRLGVTKDFQDVMRLMFLGPDWTASNIISALKLHKSKGTSVSGVGTVFSGSQIEHDIYKQFWLRIIARSAMLAAVINALMAGMDDESALQRLKKAKKRKGFKFLMADISPVIHMLGGDKGVDHYFNASGHFLDIPKIALDPIRMAYHKSSSVMKPAIDLVSGTRYDHKRPSKLSQIGTKGLYTWKTGRRGPVSPSEAPAYALYQMSQALPIQIRNIFDIAIGEENAISGILKAGIGLDIKRTYDKK